MKLDLTAIMNKYADSGEYPVNIKGIPLMEYPVLSSASIKGKADLTMFGKDSFSVTLTMADGKLSTKRSNLLIDDDTIEVSLNLQNSKCKE